MSQQHLTEAQIQEREEIFFTILNDFIEEHYEVADDYVMTEEDAYVTSIMLEYFEENYRFTTLNESIVESLTGRDSNAELYEELYEALLDESIGSFIAGARHGIQDYLAKKREARLSKSADVARQKSKQAKSDADVMAKQHKAKDKTGSYGTGVKGTLKKSFAAGGVERAAAKAQKAKEKATAKHNKQWDAKNKRYQVSKSRSDLANKIDTGIANIKNKIKSKVTSGAEKVGRTLGRAFG